MKKTTQGKALWLQLPSYRTAQSAGDSCAGSGAKQNASASRSIGHTKKERSATSLNKSESSRKPSVDLLRRRIRSISRRMSKLNRRYNADVKEWIKGKRCALFPSRKATQCHHMRGRLGPLLLDKRFWIPVSAEAHRWIDANREDARAKGLLAKAGEWHVWPDDDETKRIKNLIIELTT